MFFLKKKKPHTEVSEQVVPTETLPATETQIAESLQGSPTGSPNVSGGLASGVASPSLTPAATPASKSTQDAL